IVRREQSPTVDAQALSRFHQTELNRKPIDTFEARQFGICRTLRPFAPKLLDKLRIAFVHQERQMPKGIVENVRSRRVTEVRAISNEISHRELTLCHQLEEEFAGDQSRHRNGLPTCTTTK